MQTSWGEIPVSDAHVHFFSHGFFSALASQRPGGPPTADAVTSMLGWEAPPADPRDLAGLWARELDRHGVSRAALIASVPGDEGSVAAAIDAFPRRFYGYCMVNPLAADALERVEAAL